jgi:hypothetical protein
VLEDYSDFLPPRRRYQARCASAQRMRQLIDPVAFSRLGRQALRFRPSPADLATLVQAVMGLRAEALISWKWRLATCRVG